MRRDTEGEEDERGATDLCHLLESLEERAFLAEGGALLGDQALHRLERHDRAQMRGRQLLQLHPCNLQERSERERFSSVWRCAAAGDGPAVVV